jgi:hypothetical protein
MSEDTKNKEISQELKVGQMGAKNGTKIHRCTNLYRFSTSCVWFSKLVRGGQKLC